MPLTQPIIKLSAWRIATFCLLALTACAPDVQTIGAPIVVVTESPAPAGSAQPHLSVGDDGSVVLSWLQPDRVGVSLLFSTLRDEVWASPQRVAGGDNWFVNWADFPSVVPIADRLWAAHWLVRKSGGPYAYDVAMALSTDAGMTWSQPVTPHRDNTPTEHGFVSLFAHQGGVGAVWLDGRTAPGSEHDHTHSDAQMTLRTAVVQPDLTLTYEALLDERVCDCCQTDAVAGAVGPVVVYRDRSAAEVRDISSVAAAGAVWQTPRPLPTDGWEINGCPVNGPAVARVDAAVAVAWYSGANDAPVVRLARSSDQGNTFGRPVLIDDANPVGRVDVELFANQDTVVSWIRKVDDQTGALMVRYIGRVGEPGEAVLLGAISPSRASGFPQMVRRGKDLIFAWTDSSERGTQVRTAVIRDAQKRLGRLD